MTTTPTSDIVDSQHQSSDLTPRPNKRSRASGIVLGLFIGTVGDYAYKTYQSNKITAPVPTIETTITQDGDVLNPLPLKLKDGNLVQISPSDASGYYYSCTLEKPGQPPKAFDLDSSTPEVMLSIPVATSDELEWAKDPSPPTATLNCLSKTAVETTTLIFHVTPPFTVPPHQTS